LDDALLVSGDAREIGAVENRVLQGPCFQQSLFLLLAGGDVADIALDYVAVTGSIHVADKLHIDPPPVAGFQWFVFVADVPLLL
jgi:hypothetical protein